MNDKLTIIELERKISDLEFDLRLKARGEFISQDTIRKLKEEIEAFKLLFPNEYAEVLERLRKKKETLRVRRRSVL